MTKEILAENLVEIDGNLRKQAFGRDHPSVRPTLHRLRHMYTPHVRDLYQLFDELGVDFPGLEDWPMELYGP